MIIDVFLLFILLHFSQSEVVDLSCEQIHSFVDGHNSRRLKLAKGEVPNQPAASDMTYMIWDPELAAKAAKWAPNIYIQKASNKSVHNPDQTIPSGRFKTGENIYTRSSTNLNFKLDVESAVESWFSEYKRYKYGPLAKSDFHHNKKHIGHYTQMVWSKSFYLGCGISQRLANGRKYYYFVCNYGPRGNHLRQTPYEANGARDNLICRTGICDRPYGDKC